MPEEDLRTADFDYDLPEELIASEPTAKRDQSRMLVVDREKGVIEHRQFADLPGYVDVDDLFVFNNTRVVRARFFSTDGRNIELVRLEETQPLTWKCLVRPGKKMRLGKKIEVGDATGEVIDVLQSGERLICFDRPVDEEAHGHLALPHYMNREDQPSDHERYQTVYAEKEGAIAAPTAGLHFTPELMETLPHAFLTLHVGVGTFAPVKAERVQEHQMHSERFELNEEACAAIKSANRVTAVGTTVMRVLEHLVSTGGVRPCVGETDIFIYPPYQFGAVDRLLTNFHLPQSTLLMLVSAFAGTELIQEAYAQAVAERYRFFSYGDCMLIL
ncbi:MAG: tRNA preQ1(34) S-adenosylmethionine ribosyltransferase-isomerase QueA [Verrucomicrobiota bacterium]